MYEELVKRLRDDANRRSPCSAVGLMCSEAADAIEELQRQIDAWVEPERKALIKSLPRWIPVSETPPRKVGDDGYNGYLVYANGYYEVADYTADWYSSVPYFHVGGEYEPNVTHWMPLPEPPKEE